MPRTKISEFSATAASNTDIDSINIAENCPPSGINDAIRELMAQLKDFQTGAVGDSFNGPVGTTTAAAGAFTTLSASSTVSGTGFSTYLASPPAIGGTAAAAGAFTTLSASGAVTLSGGTANGVAYLNGSKVVTSGSALTFSGQQFAISSLGDQIKISNSVGNQLLTLSSNSAGSVFTSHDGTSFVPILWQSNTAEQMRLTSTGLGIGTSSPATKLQVYGGALTVGNESTYAARFGNNSNKGVTIGYDTTNNVGHIGSINPAVAWTDLVINANGGNLGLGVTPSAWASGQPAMQIGAGTAINNRSAVLSQFSSNQRWDGSSHRYLTTGTATLYTQNDGAHSWATAASGTAGNAITFTQAATLNANGNFLVGCTSFPSASVAGIGITGTSSGNASSSGASTSAYNQWLFYNGNGIVGSISTSGSTTTYSTSSDYRLKNITGSITTSGAYIDSLNPVEGTWKADGSTFVGLIAHEVQEVSRTQVATGVKDGAEMQAMDYSNSELIANLIAEVKSLRQRVATLEAK